MTQYHVGLEKLARFAVMAGDVDSVSSRGRIDVDGRGARREAIGARRPLHGSREASSRPSQHPPAAMRRITSDGSLLGAEPGQERLAPSSGASTAGIREPARTATSRSIARRTVARRTRAGKRIGTPSASGT